MWDFCIKVSQNEQSWVLFLHHPKRFQQRTNQENPQEVAEFHLVPGERGRKKSLRAGRDTESVFDFRWSQHSAESLVLVLVLVLVLSLLSVTLHSVAFRSMHTQKNYVFMILWIVLIVLILCVCVFVCVCVCQSLLGNLDSAMRTFQNYYSVWRQFGGLPEFYSIPQGYTVDKREGYPLRPGRPTAVLVC